MPLRTREIYANGQLIATEFYEISAAAHNAPIKAQLADIDARSIRALREGNAARLTELETQAAALRAQLVTEE